MELALKLSVNIVLIGTFDGLPRCWREELMPTFVGQQECSWFRGEVHPK